jgi:hypothetical protein
MSALAERRRQAGQLVRLRQVRMDAAARALADARIQTARAEAARAEADAAADAADATLAASREDLATDPAEAERLLAVLDQSRFRQSVARSALNDAREAERICAEAEVERRRAMILARARHDVLNDHVDGLARRLARQREDMAAQDSAEPRRMG